MENRIELEKPESAHAAPEVKAKACCGHHQFEKATEVLKNEHRVIERVLAVVEKLTAAPVQGRLDSWKEALDFFSRFADQCHHFKEEQVLCPAMEERGIPRDGGPTGMMLMEHEEGRAYVRSMLAAIALVETKNEAAKEILVDKAKAYLRLLREHIQKEDEVLFRIADDVIPADEQKPLHGAVKQGVAHSNDSQVVDNAIKDCKEILDVIMAGKVSEWLN